MKIFFTIILAFFLLGIGEANEISWPDLTNATQFNALFCGELGIAGDTFFAGPVNDLLGAGNQDHSFGSANCNLLGNTLLSSVENNIEEFQSYIVTRMFCQITGITTVNTTFTFIDDSVFSSVTCMIPAGETSCLGVIGNLTSVVKNSLVAISSLNVTDNLSSEDMHCNTYLVWN